ncbi:MAG: helix-turn-helix domain-containing protein [Candidatus Nitrohelix vancouverensis]|uniref:Helix-turn-helix domain-containing protein n=1 Tax=Candidatus Nitrohelix vancouverensis TaxID=2705534 RepID=A0A7T0G4G6_9BACT|nr:MAG: helix-turn-helix domain-containing protein [Candidatus Nitrohelix vancouverensis]
MKKRDIGHEILKSLQDIKQGKGKRIKSKLPPSVKTIRDNMGLSQSAFVGFLGVSVRTLQEWEQGRRKPSGPATVLLKVAHTHPVVLLQSEN